MADMNMKIKGLKLLVQNGILTNEECDICIGALSGEQKSVVVSGRRSTAGVCTFRINGTLFSH